MRRGESPWAAQGREARKAAKAMGHKLARFKTGIERGNQHHAMCANDGCRAVVWFEEKGETWGSALTAPCPTGNLLTPVR